METLERLRSVNDVRINSIEDEEFKTYGRVVKGYDFSEMIKVMENETEIPDEGNIYVPSVKALESCNGFKNVRDVLYGGMEIQIGYCNGKNTTYNGFEYHKGSEINVAVTDFMLVLGHLWEIEDNSYKVEDARVFYVPRGTAIEMYETTLHLSPCRVSDEGFKDIVILPKGTNTDLEVKRTDDGESKLLLQRNKWVIAHPTRIQLISKGAYPGLIGENKELRY